MTDDMPFMDALNEAMSYRVDRGWNVPGPIRDKLRHLHDALSEFDPEHVTAVEAAADEIDDSNGIMRASMRDAAFCREIGQMLTAIRPELRK